MKGLVMNDDATPGQDRVTDGLGALPNPAFGLLDLSNDDGKWREAPKGEPAFDVQQMRAYAAEQVAEERERCASMAENYDLGTPEGHAIAACIRGGQR